MADEKTSCPELESYVAAQYGIPVRPGCSCLIRHGFNDTYLIEAVDTKYIFRIYLNRKYYIRSADDFRFELEWLSFLNANGSRVAHPIRALDGQLLGMLPDGNEGVRYFALFTFAHGEHKNALTESEAYQVGQVLANLHVASNAFSSGYFRYELNLDYLTDQPLTQIDLFLRDYGRDGVAPYLPRVAELEAPIRRIPITPETYGLIHGDLHPGNMHFNAAGEPTLFDFDHSGYGWRAYDLATCLVDMPEAVSEALLTAYYDIRPLLPEERESIPAFQRIRPIWDVGDILAMRTAWQNHAKFGADFADKIETRLKNL